MATHNENIENLRSAVYGEQVRSSMIQLFEEDYTMVSKAVGYGTDVTGADSSVEGYSDGNIYINSNTLNVYQTNGTTWIYVGNLKGIASISTEESSADSGTNTVTFTLTDGTTKTFNVKNGRGISSINVTESSVDNANNVVNVNMSDGSSTSFNVKNGKTGAQGDSVTDVIDKGQGKFAFKLSNNTETASTVQAVKGETGDKGAKGDKGDTGRGLTSITSYNSGKQHTLTANYTDGTNSIVCTVRDGADGSAGGDMFKATYDVNDDGVVDSASSLTDGTKTIMVSDIEAKANKATTLSGYGITDALKTPTENGTQGQLLSLDADGNNVWRDEYITNTSTEFSVTSKTLSLASGITNKLQNLNESGKISSDNVLDGSSDVSITNKLTHLSETDGTISSDYVKVGTSTLSSEISKKITGYKDAKIKAHSGKLLGTSFTSEQSSKIRGGDFSWCEIGDYWTIGGHNWRIWDIDWYLNKGDTSCSTHHLVIMPDDNLLDADGSSTHYMNDTNTTDGGYAGTKYRSTYKSQCESSVNSSFGSGHILSHRELLCNAVASGKTSGWAWYDCSVEIPSEVMMYGSTIWSNYTDGGSGYNVGTAYPQLALAYLDPSRVANRENYWLRDAASASWFAGVAYDGLAYRNVASHAGVGVRPYFLLY